MKDPTRLAAIKALCERRVHDGDKYIEVPLYFASAAANPEYGLQALAAEVERLQEREKPVLVKRSQGFKVYACSCGGYPDRAHKFCPHCGREIEWL